MIRFSACASVLLTLLLAVVYMPLAVQGQQYDSRSRGAIITLKDRTVLEGVLLRQGKKGRKVIYVFADEEGVEFSVNEGDIESLQWKDPVWLAEIKFAPDYAKKVAKLSGKGWKDHIKVAKWCGKRNMRDSERAQLLQAYEKQWQAVEATPEWHWTVAEWCKSVTLHDKYLEHVQKAYDLLKGNPESVTADLYLTLAQWCDSKGLRDWAKRDYQATLEMAPDHADAKAGLDKILAAEKAERDDLLKTYRKQRRIWQIRFCIEWDCEDDELAFWERHVRTTAHMLFTITEGQFLIDEITVTDNSTAGNVLLTIAEKNKGGGHTDGSISWVGGLSGPGTILHEFFHGRFDLVDEHNLSCKCIMGMGSELCDKEMHNHATKSCWEIIMARFSMARHPNPDWTWYSKDGMVSSWEGMLKIGNFQWEDNPILKVTVTNTEPKD